MDNNTHYNDNSPLTWETTQYLPVFDKIKDKFDTKPKTPVKKVELQNVVVSLKDKPCFVLYNVLSPEECKHLIEASEAIGFEKAEAYCHYYRDRYNDRLMSDDPLFSKIIWERTKEFIPEYLFTDWKVRDLNPRWRYCKYHPGHYFGPHTDGRWRPSLTESSHLTFMLYLNTQGHDHQGGSTNFLTRNKQIKLGVAPEAGMAVVFLQEDMELYHEGAKLTQGVKHILRTDVMYVKTKSEDLK